MDSWIVKSVIMRKANGFVRLYSNVISDVLVLPSITCCKLPFEESWFMVLTMVFITSVLSQMTYFFEDQISISNTNI